MKRKFTAIALIMGLAVSYSFGQTCAPPTTLDAVVNPLTVDITLDGTATYEKCEFQVRVLGDPTWSRARLDVTSLPLTFSVNVLSNLAALTTYELRARCACDLSDITMPDVSPFTPADTFTTGDTPSVRLAQQPLEISAYPNPATDFITLNYTSVFDGVITATVIDLAGRTVATREFNTVSGVNALRLDLEGIEGGSYFIRATDGVREHVESLTISAN